MTERERRCLVVVHEPGQTAGRVGERLRERGVRLVETMVCPSLDTPDGSFVVDAPEAYDLIVTFGSQWHVHDAEPLSAWLPDELALLRAADVAGVPVLGVCFGAQVLSVALGGTAGPNDSDQIGWFSPDEFVPVMAGLWFEWHSDGFVPPDGADVLARDSAGVQAFRLRSNVGVQFHPEVGSEQLARWIELGADNELREVGTDPVALVEQTRFVNDDALRRCDRLVDWFLDDVAALPLPARRTGAHDHG